jgi:hypothetical protein
MRPIDSRYRPGQQLPSIGTSVTDVLCAQDGSAQPSKPAMPAVSPAAIVKSTASAILLAPPGGHARPAGTTACKRR